MSHRKTHRFLVQELISPAIGETITINESDIAHQLYSVLKLEPGESIGLFSNGSDTAIGEIILLDKKSFTIKVSGIEPAPLIPRTIIACISIVKGDAFKIIVQKLTEIGVQTIVPIISGRTVKQNVRTDRLQAISDEALEQCGGTARVTISEPVTLAECIEKFPVQSVVFDPLATQSVIPQPAETIACYIGPEGGWNEEDEAIIERAQCIHLQITNRVLRTETAAIIGAYTLLWQ